MHIRKLPPCLLTKTTWLLRGLCYSSPLPFASGSSSCWSMISLWCGSMRRGSCSMGACSPVLMSCSIRSNYPKSELLIANMPSYWSISGENCLFCSSERPSELGWITFVLQFFLSVLSCLSSLIFLPITEQYGWLGADGLPSISVGVALPLTPDEKHVSSVTASKKRFCLFAASHPK